MRKLPLFRAIKRKLAPTANKPADKSQGWIRKPGIGMVSPEEMRFYYESAARYVGKKGAVVDLGCWLGSTSIALAQGILSHASKPDYQKDKVLGFDIFQWEDWMPVSVPYCRYLAGESFLPEARRIVSEHGGGRVELVQADLRSYQWSGEPIKILLVDAMKNPDLAAQIARSFFPSLTSESLLIHQDFKHYFTGSIHLIHFRLREYFRFYRSVPIGTVAFDVIASIPQAAVEQATDFAGIKDEEVDSSFLYSLGLVEPGERVNIAAAHVMYYVQAKRKDAASSLVETYRSDGMLDKGEFPKALNCLNQLG